MDEGDFNFPKKWGSGLLILLVTTAAVFRTGDYQIVGEGVAAGFFLAIIPVFFTGPHPMSNFATVRHVTADGFIESDNVFLRSAPVVRMLESKGSRESSDGGWIGVERYIYSPRIGILLGKSLGEGVGSPELGYEISGFPAWLFGVRVACERFVFYAASLTPFILTYCDYCHWKKKAPKNSLNLDPKSALFLTGPFVIGLLPLISS